ncbi:MAG TPA: PP2C family serine/threonine-protein phosphatase, partial [Pyrinomonadaceae bacterium]
RSHTGTLLTAVKPTLTRYLKAIVCSVSRRSLGDLVMENNFKISSAAVSDRGLSDKRPENEDSFLVLEDLGIFAVADGVGGAQAGDVASQMAMEILGEAFVNHAPGLDAEDLMRAAIDRANSAIYQMASDLPQLASMATTIVALHLDGNIATIGHVGDSRLYRLDHHGNLRRETDDHSVVEEEVRAGRMTAAQAATHPSKNVISRALGAEPDVEIDLKTIMVEPGSTFLLCSDGVTRHVSDDEIGGFLAAKAEPAEVCERLKEICYERGAEDNLTAVIIRVLGEPAREFSAAAAAAGSGDVDEVTVASARSPFDSKVEDAPPAEMLDLSNGNAVPIDELDDQSYLMEEPLEVNGTPAKPDLHDYSSSSFIVPARPPQQKPVSRPQPAPVFFEPPSAGIGSKLLSAVVFLLLGGILGAAGYYFWVQSQPEPVVETPVITEMKSNNVPLNAFEEGRRLVDKDPAAYINANAASAREVDDYFLLGRAFLLTGKYWEAKRAFNEARNKLATADPNNSKTLATEISMALAIIESPQATESFTKDVTTANASAPANSANSNVTAPPPANR